MAKSPKPLSESIPFKHEVGDRIGRGQDNAVYRLVYPAAKPHLRHPTGQVIKLNHENAGPNRYRHPDERTALWQGVSYKKNKYDILKMFLGDVIPDSSFVLGQVTEGSKQRTVEYTVQKEVPHYKLSDLTSEQQKDPRLVQNMSDLLRKLQYMYKVLGEVNARTSGGINLDAKLDLGGVSDYVKAEELGHEFDENDAVELITTNKSPNMLIDPASMHIYCIDFDQGQWVPGMSQAKTLAESIVVRDQTRAQAMGVVAVSHPLAS